MSRERDTCQECSSLPLPGERRCQTCKDFHNLREAKRRDDRRAQGLCVPCGEPAVPLYESGKLVGHMSYCDGCRAKNDARRLAVKQRRQREKKRLARAATGGR